MNRRRTGTLWEHAAEAYLKEHGYEILERNFRCREGEVDLIAKEGGSLVFIEVRYRKTLKKGHPMETVDAAKQRRICRVSRYYLMKNHLPFDTPVRYDVAAVLDGTIELVKNAFPYQI